MRLQNPLTAISPSLDMGALYVLARADADFTAPGICSLLPEPSSLAGVRKALARLVDQGIVVEKVAGRTHIFRLNRHHLLAKAVEEMASAKAISSSAFGPRSSCGNSRRLSSRFMARPHVMTCETIAT